MELKIKLKKKKKKAKLKRQKHIAKWLKVKQIQMKTENKSSFTIIINTISSKKR